jgi:apoptosis-inducing factor 2
MRATVAVVGGGYGGIAVAKALDDVVDVVLVEPRDTFVHNVAALRGLVEPAWVDRLFLPYDRLLTRGRVVHERAVRVDRAGVTLGSGDRLAADYVVLATGSAYPFPAKFDIDDDSDAIKVKIHAAHESLAEADNVLLLGAGPVGLEMAGEIRAVWPTKSVTIVDRGPDILSGRFTHEFRGELRGQLDALAIELILNTVLVEEPQTPAGDLKSFTATTRSGRDFPVDIWFRCFGVRPETNYLVGALSGARRPNGHIEVTPQLRLPGQDNVFAIGDITALPEAKMAKAAGLHADVVARNIRTLLDGRGDLVAYEPAAPGISLPLGPRAGASYTPETGILGADATARLKGADLRTGLYAKLLGR